MSKNSGLFCFFFMCQNASMFGASEKPLTMQDSKKKLEELFVKDQEGRFAQDIEDICAEEIDYFYQIEGWGYSPEGCGLQNGVGMPCRSLPFLASLYKKEEYFFHLMKTIPDAFNENDLQTASFHGSRSIRSYIENRQKALQGKENVASPTNMEPRIVEREYATGERIKKMKTLEANEQFIEQVNSLSQPDPSIKFEVAKNFLGAPTHQVPSLLSGQHPLKQNNQRHAAPQESVENKETQARLRQGKRKHD